MVKKKVCIFISCKGSNLNNLFKRSRDYNFPANIELVVCNNRNALGIKFAKKYSIPLLIIDTKLRNHENFAPCYIIYFTRLLKAKYRHLVQLRR